MTAAAPLPMAAEPPQHVISGFAYGLADFWRASRDGTYDAADLLRRYSDRDGAYGVGKGVVVGSVHVAQAVTEGACDFIVDVLEGVRNTPDTLAALVMGGYEDASAEKPPGVDLTGMEDPAVPGAGYGVQAPPPWMASASPYADFYAPHPEGEQAEEEEEYEEEEEEVAGSGGQMEERSQRRILQSTLTGQQPLNVIDGLAEGTLALGLGVARGVESFVNEPVVALRGSNGAAMGLAEGLTTGCLGLVAGPTAGTLDFAQSLTEGVRNTPNVIVTGTTALLQAGVRAAVYSGVNVVGADGSMSGNMENPRYVRALLGAGYGAGVEGVPYPPAGASECGTWRPFQGSAGQGAFGTYGTYGPTLAALGQSGYQGGPGGSFGQNGSGQPGMFMADRPYASAMIRGM